MFICANFDLRAVKTEGCQPYFLFKELAGLICDNKKSPSIVSKQLASF